MIAAVVVLVGLQAILAFGQSTGSIDLQAGDLKFDAVSLKPASAPGPGAGLPYGLSGLVYANGNTVYGHNATLEMMVGYAYKLFRQAGGEIRKLEGPDLLRSARYDLVAKAEGPATLPELRLMMRKMLAERFHLAVHVEDRLTPISVLEAAKKGPKLEPSSEPPDSVSSAGHQRLKANAATMDDLAFHIATWVLHTPVLNQTGLSGHYKFRLDYSSPDSAIPGGPANQNQPLSPGSASAAIVSAVEQQLGLRLTARKMPVPVLIVDRAEPPTEN